MSETNTSVVNAPATSSPDWSKFLDAPLDEPILKGDRPGEKEGWDSIKYMIFQVCKGFQQYWGGNYDDYIEEAYELWLKAHRSYNPNKEKLNPSTGKVVKVKYTTWTRYIVFRGLLDRIGKTCKEAERFPKYEGEADECCKHSHFNLRKLLFEISDDAATALRLLFTDAPDKLTERRIIASRDELARTLATELNWGWRRIDRVFNEIKEALDENEQAH